MNIHQGTPPPDVFSMPRQNLLALARLLNAVNDLDLIDMGMSNEELALLQGSFEVMDDYLMKVVGPDWIGTEEDAE